MMEAKRWFRPEPGKYRKIDVSGRIEGTGVWIYLHSTTAFDTLRHAEINAAMHYAERKVSVHQSGQEAICAVDPYSIRARYAHE